MADDQNHKVTEFTALTTPAAADLLQVIDDSESVNLKNKKVLISDLILDYARTQAEIDASVTPVNFLYPPGNVLRYGTNTTPGTTDMTTAITNAILVVRTAGGGDVIIPAGNYGVTSVASVWTSSVTVNIRGEGKFATILRKTGATTTPVLDLSAASLVESYSSISDLRVIGNAKAHDGIRATLLARFDVSRVRIDTCDVAVDSVGSLVFSVYDPTFQSNNTGYKCRKSGTVRANLVQFFGGQISANTSFGMDIGDASGVHLYGTDLSGNGTSANLATGAIFVRNTVDDESGVAYMSLNGCWLEDNLGMAIDVDDSNLSLAIRSMKLLSSESGNAMDIGDIRSLLLEDVMAATSGDTITVAAKNFTVSGGNIDTLVDNSTQSSTQDGVALSTGTTGFRSKQIKGELGDSDTFSHAGVIDSTQQVAVGNVGTGEDDLMSYTLPADSFSAAGKGIRITAWGTTANNGNTKTLKIYFDGTLIDSIVLTVSQVNSWRYSMDVLWRASGNATCIAQCIQGGTATQVSCGAVTVTGITETAAIIAKLTGEATANDDILQRGMLVEFI